MSGAGSPTLNVDGTGLDIVIVAASWHDTIMGGLVDSAVRTLEEAGANHTLVRVPGSFELPVVSRAALEAGADAVVALGVIIRGGTPHFEYVSDAATSGLTQVTVETGKPVGFGVLTLDDEQQGLDRAGLPGSKEDKGREAAEAAIATVRALTAVRA
ncbi:6,7-dimethyl-8-ribityllumazine synthase [Paramicrobacterium fandaimingii]|uniref:6,7-dimethyl-8-ribityllumazine synthase n=1 Tax=Paramicrobacterium fandaimingii TaxID=2708079 RepID=UPI00141ED832|nr:6,7-dimethyl-8-ribityllumazine synthase [Microbacterium fandaimingii]